MTYFNFIYTTISNIIVLFFTIVFIMIAYAVIFWLPTDSVPNKIKSIVHSKFFYSTSLIIFLLFLFPYKNFDGTFSKIIVGYMFNALFIIELIYQLALTMAVISIPTFFFFHLFSKYLIRNINSPLIEETMRLVKVISLILIFIYLLLMRPSHFSSFPH